MNLGSIYKLRDQAHYFSAGEIHKAENGTLSLPEGSEYLTYITDLTMLGPAPGR